MPHADRLRKALLDRSAVVGVMGLGYVGLPLALAFVRAGFRTLGFEVDMDRVRALEAHRSYVGDVPSSELGEAMESGRFAVTGDAARLAEPDTISICVPTPLRKTRDPDMSYITAALDQIGPRLRPGQLVVLESTSYPGTTEEMLVPMIQGAGLTVGEEVFVANSPERVDPANERWTIENTPKVVGGVTGACTDLATVLYGSIVEQVVPVSRPMAAELTKLFENTFRAVNIGLANEMALICRELGVDTWEVIEAAATKPFGFMPFYPGPGIGGHCVPVDPLYLSWKLRTQKVQSRFIDLADAINRRMPEYVVSRAMHQLNAKERSVRGSRILLLGVAYKPDVSDVRESPALDIFASLSDLGADVVFHDPFVDALEIAGRTHRSVALSPDELARAQLTIILTHHRSFEPALIRAHAVQILDTRNLMRAFREDGIERL